jgi:hypothetical protein
MHFELTLPSEQLLLFKVAKLREISLKRRADGIFELMFWLELNAEQANLAQPEQSTQVLEEAPASSSLIPDYVSVEVAA